MSARALYRAILVNSYIRLGPFPTGGAERVAVQRQGRVLLSADLRDRRVSTGAVLGEGVVPVECNDKCVVETLQETVEVPQLLFFDKPGVVQFMDKVAVVLVGRQRRNGGGSAVAAILRCGRPVLGQVC